MLGPLSRGLRLGAGLALAGTALLANVGGGGGRSVAAAAPPARSATVATRIATAVSPDVSSINQGYWLVAHDGGIFPFGAAGGFGSLGNVTLNQPVVGMTPTPDGGGYWMVAADGGIFPFGNAGGFGSTGNIHLNQPMVAMASTADGKGYWLVARDGGVFPFGDAIGYGSTGGIHLNQPIVGMAGTPDGRGYWLVASDGGIFPFGDAGGYGSTGGIHLNQSITNMTPSHDGKGYWLCARDGGIFPFGDAVGYGSTGGIHLNRPISAMAGTPDGGGYWLGATDGGIFPFGDAQGLGSLGNRHLNAPIIAVVGAPPIGLIPLGGGGPITADQGAAGTPIVFELTRAGGSQVANATIQFSLSGLVHGTLSAPSAVTGQDGKVSVVFKDTFAGDTGTVIARVKNTGSQTAAPPITVSPGAPTVLTVAPNTASTVSADGTSIVASVADAESNLINGATVNFTPHFAHAEFVNPVSVVTGVAGISGQALTTLFNGTINDVGNVTAAVAGGPAANSGQLTISAGAPTKFTVTPNAAASQSADCSGGAGCGTANVKIIFTLLDNQNNPVAGQTISPTPSGFTGASVNPSTQATNSAGQATFTLVDTKAESGTVGATTATGLSASTAAITVTPGVYTQFQAVSTYPGGTITAGTQTGGITVNTFDAFLNPQTATGHTFGFAGLSNSPNNTAPVLTPTIGATQTSFAFTPFAAQGGASLSIDGVLVGSGINVVAAGYQPGHVTGSFSGNVQAGSASPLIAVNTFDNWNNPTAPPPTFTASGSVMQSSPNNTPATFNNGSAGASFRQVSFTPFASQSGGTLVIDGVAIGSGITVTPGSTLMGQSTNPTTITVTQASQQFTVNLTVTDQYGNTNGVTFSVTIDHTANGDGGTAPSSVAITNGAGSFTYTASANTPSSATGTLAFSNSFQSVAITD